MTSSDELRIEVAAAAIRRAAWTHKFPRPEAQVAVEAVDALDRSNGIIRVDPSDPATIERAARALHAKDCGCTDYDHGATVERGDYRDLAAAVLASLTDTGDNKEQTNG